MKLNLFKPLAILLVLFLTGCGQKGPLYLPEQPKPAAEQPEKTDPAQPESTPKAQ